jgi:GntR family transcriptional regulator
MSTPAPNGTKSEGTAPQLPMRDGGQQDRDAGVPLGGPLDKTSPVPLYFQIAENLRSAIESGRLQPGDRLDNEIQICERLNVSRPTVSQAIQRLAHEGLVVRQRGRGTEVVDRPIDRPLALSSLYDDLESAGRRPRTEVLEVAEVAADSKVAESLGLPSGQGVVRLERLRFADERPLAVMINFLPAGFLRVGDVREALSTQGLYETLRSEGVQFRSAEEIIGARRATAREAELLQVPRNRTVLTMSRVAYDASRKPIEYGVHAYLAERYSFRVSLKLG